MTIRFLPLATALLVMSVALSAAVSVKQSNDLPLLYYYSLEEEGFIVEPANGGNREIIGRYSLPEYAGQRASIGGPGWSPSGEWFAWTLANTSNPRTLDANVTNLEGNTISLIESPEGTELNIVNLFWSTIGNTLHVLYLYVDVDEELEFSEEFLFDPTQRERTVSPSQSRNPRLAVEWIRGGYLIDYEISWLETTEEYEYTMLINSPDGNYNQRNIFLDSGCDRRTLPFWSPASTVAYIDAETRNLIIAHVNGSQIAEINLNGENVQFIDWDGSGEFALIYLSSNCDIEHTELALLSVSNGTLTTILPDATLPETFYRSRIFANEHIYFPYVNTGWSSSADFYAVLSNGHPYVVDVSKLTAAEVSLGDGDATIFAWSLSKDELFIGQSNNSGVELFRYRPAENELNLLTETEDIIRQISPSPSGRYFAYSLEFGNAYVFDLSSGQTHEIVPENKMNTLGFDVMWHPELDWFLLASDITTDTRQVFVVNADTLEIREIGVCGNTFSCFGWLPE